MNDPLATDVVWRVAEEKGVDPVALPPLSDVVDPAALEAISEPRLDGTPRSGCAVQFEYAGVDVLVQNGTVTVDGTGDAAR